MKTKLTARSISRRNLLATGAAAFVITPFSALAQSYTLTSPGVYTEEEPLDQSIQPATTAVTVFVSLAEVEQTLSELGSLKAFTAHSLIEVDGHINAGTVKSSPEFYRSLELFFTNGGREALIINAHQLDSVMYGDMQHTLAALSKYSYNLLYFPTAASHFGSNDAALLKLYRKAADTVEEHSAMLLIDASDDALTSPNWMAGITANAQDVIAYTPSLIDPLGQKPACGACGAVAGMMARLDEQHSVWSAPAGPGATILGAKPKIQYTSAQAGQFANIKVNPIIASPTDNAPVVWGVNTRSSHSDWLYVQHRRYYNFLKQSIEAGLLNFVFDANDQNTWSGVELKVSAFMQQQLQIGAISGEALSDGVGIDSISGGRHAYQVSCGLGSTMVPEDVLAGRLIVAIRYTPSGATNSVDLRVQIGMDHA